MENEDSAVIAYKISRDEVVELLKDIQGKIEVHDAEQAEDLTNWGYVAMETRTQKRATWRPKHARKREPPHPSISKYPTHIKY